jgi:hypothetical protein
MEGISKKMTKHEKIVAAEDRTMAYWIGLMVGCFVWSNTSVWNIIIYGLIGLIIIAIIVKAVEVFWRKSE